MIERARLDAALHRASDEMGLDPCYRDCVRPLLTLPEARWPSCCGGACEPCSELLARTARRVQQLLDAGG